MYVELRDIYDISNKDFPKDQQSPNVYFKMDCSYCIDLNIRFNKIGTEFGGIYMQLAQLFMSTYVTSYICLDNLDVLNLSKYKFFRKNMTCKFKFNIAFSGCYNEKHIPQCKI